MSIEPKERRYKTQDATTEKLGEILIDNPQGLLVYRDELSGWLNSFEKNGREGDRPFFLESWSGNQSFDVDRIERGILHIPSLCLSVFGSIQPGPLTQYIRSAIHGDAGDDGFIQRFQVMVWPDTKDHWELVQGIPLNELETPVNHIFSCIDTLMFDPLGEPIIFSFTNDAQTLFDQWQKSHEKRVRLNKLEKDKANNKLWAFIGIGKPQSPQHQRMLEVQARESFYASGGDRNAYLAFMPFDSFSIGYVTKSDLATKIMNKTKNPAES